MISAPVMSAAVVPVISAAVSAPAPVTAAPIDVARCGGATHAAVQCDGPSYEELLRKNEELERLLLREQNEHVNEVSSVQYAEVVQRNAELTRFLQAERAEAAKLRDTQSRP